MTNDRERLSRQYSDKQATFQALVNEVMFVLRMIVEEHAIRVHEINGRVKELDSIIIKCDSRGITQNQLEFLTDIAGVRIVCLFRSDIEKIANHIRTTFEIIEDDDKINEKDDTFGYMSHHFICELPRSFSGPRYDQIRNVRFEIQIRTLCMHAWAVISHYVDYKNSLDAPPPLRKSFNALSGLFYVADTEFENFYNSRISSAIDANEVAKERNDTSPDINFDSISAYLNNTFPNRKHTVPQEISDFVDELRRAGYNNIREIDTKVKSASQALEAYEKRYRPTERKFADIGAARISLGITSKRYREIKYNGDTTFDEFESMIL